MDERISVQFGLPDEWESFAVDHRIFLEKFPDLKKTLELCFLPTGSTTEPVDRVVFFLGRLCCEDFLEILLLCGNGYGIGGLKILRGMYEQVVTGHYLHLHPEQAEAFLDFHWIQQHRLAEAIKETFGKDALTKQAHENVEANFQRVKKDFEVADCKKCGTKKIDYKWSKLDFVSMARGAGKMGELIVPDYYIPMRHAHSTMGAILDRLQESEAGGISFDAGPQCKWADHALMSAHSLLLKVLGLQAEHFGLKDLDEPLEKCLRDFLEIWKKS